MTEEEEEGRWVPSCFEGRFASLVVREIWSGLVALFLKSVSRLVRPFFVFFSHDVTSPPNVFWPACAVCTMLVACVSLQCGGRAGDSEVGAGASGAAQVFHQRRPAAGGRLRGGKGPGARGDGAAQETRGRVSSEFKTIWKGGHESMCVFDDEDVYVCSTLWNSIPVCRLTCAFLLSYIFVSLSFRFHSSSAPS